MIRKEELVETIARQSNELKSCNRSNKRLHKIVDCAIKMRAELVETIEELQDDLDKLRPPDFIEWEDLQEFTDYKTADGDVITLLIKNHLHYWFYRTSENSIRSVSEEWYGSEDGIKFIEVIAEREIV